MNTSKQPTLSTVLMTVQPLAQLLTDRIRNERSQGPLSISRNPIRVGLIIARLIQTCSASAGTRVCKHGNSRPHTKFTCELNEHSVQPTHSPSLPSARKTSAASSMLPTAGCHHAGASTSPPSPPSDGDEGRSPSMLCHNGQEQILKFRKRPM